MRILYAASEAARFAKSGGLADVAGALPKALVKDGVDARVDVYKRQNKTRSTEPTDVAAFKNYLDEVKSRLIYLSLIHI